jgi:diaminopimelate decarboxylase
MTGTKKAYQRPNIIKQQAGFMNKLGTRAFTTPLREIDGLPIPRLVEQFGSPLFVLSEAKIRQNQRRAIRVFKTRYPKVQFAWSYKTNYLDAVCSVFHQEGSWAEVVSEFEYDKARRLGIPGSRIIFNGPGKSIEALTKAVKDGARIHVDHFDELYSLIELTEKLGQNASVALRINMDTGIHPAWDRFGFNFESGEARQALARVLAAPTLKLVGLHTHIGTYIMTADAYRIAATKLSLLAKELREQHQCSLEYLDLGGGFASHNTLIGQYLPAEGVVPTLEQFADAIAAGLLEHAPAPSELPTLFLETGRALVDDAGWLVTTVLANKRLSDGRRALIVDAGVNVLLTSFWYKHQISPVADHGVVCEDATLYGPLCMNIDVLREQVTLPPLNKGDQLVVHRVGAYDLTQWLQFITLRPNVVMIMENGDVELIRKAETLDYLLQQEQLPQSLKRIPGEK